MHAIATSEAAPRKHQAGGTVNRQRGPTVWNFKRIVMLAIGLAVHLAGYATYAVFLGNIDALPPLPEHYAFVASEKGPQKAPPRNPVDEKLEQSFGSGCKELQRPLRLWLPDRGAAFAAGEFNIESDGRVKLAPFSAAIYHKRKLPGDFPEITTLRCDTALLTLDKAIANFSELNGRKVIAVELRGKQISITNNRGTAEKSDDLDVLVTNAPLFYEESRDRISTDGVVCLTDYASKPPTEVRGKGMEMLLAKSTNPNGKAKEPAPGRSDSASVDKVILHSDVQMDFWSDENSGFLGGPPVKKTPAEAAKQAAKAEEGKPAAKSHIRIHTGGMFVYDLTKEFAWFESPPVAEATSAKPAADPLAPNQVHVERYQTGKAKIDQLICDRLELQFRKKAAPTPDEPAASPAAGGDKEIESAKAFKRGDGEVVLALDTEGMAAYCSELHYFAGDANRGPKTILKGDKELRSFKDGHKLVCKELHLQSANRAGEGQEVKAWGPGQIDLLDEKNPQEEKRPTHVLWLDTLTVVKVKEGSEQFDLMTVEKDASFVDDVQKQELHAEKIMVWLISGNEASKKTQAVGSSKQEIRKLIAEQRVRAFAPEFIVRQSDHLTMTFLPEVTRTDRAPVLPKASAVEAGPAAVQPGGPPPAQATTTAPQPGPAKKDPAEEKKPGPPIEMTAKKISVYVSTVGAKKQVEGLVAQGKVYVFQPGEKPGEKKIDITGELLTIKNCDDKGHKMVVHGKPDAKARVELNDLILWGPIVTIDQALNKADVDGDGAMQLPTNKNLDGSDIAKDKKDPAKPSPKITVFWKKRMTFDGKAADFYGGVQAVQQGSYSRMTCEHLQTYLDRFVSFKEAEKPAPDGKKEKEKDKEAKIDRIVCDQNVYVDDTKVDKKGQFEQRNIMQCWLLDNYQDGRTNATGPGQCKQLAQGGSEGTLGPQGQKGPAQPKEKSATGKGQWMLTHVKYPSRMFYNQEDKIKKATFWADPGTFVEVYHFPTTDINATMDPDHPPKDGLYLRCENLVVRGEEHGERTTQVMVARQNVYFHTDVYTGYADVMKFDENTDMVTLECSGGNFVRLYKMDENGNREPVAFRSERVLYNRKSGEIVTTGVKSIEN